MERVSRSSFQHSRSGRERHHVLYGGPGRDQALGGGHGHFATKSEILSLRVYPVRYKSLTFRGVRPACTSAPKASGPFRARASSFRVQYLHHDLLEPFEIDTLALMQRQGVVSRFQLDERSYPNGTLMDPRFEKSAVWILRYLRA